MPTPTQSTSPFALFDPGPSEATGVLAFLPPVLPILLPSLSITDAASRYVSHLGLQGSDGLSNPTTSIMLGDGLIPRHVTGGTTPTLFNLTVRCGETVPA